MTTITRRIAASQPRPRRRGWFNAWWCVPLSLLLATFVLPGPQGAGPRYPDLSHDINTVTCKSAENMSVLFALAVADAQKSSPDYTSVKQFGFKPPLNPADVAPLQASLKARQAQLDAKARAVAEGKCTDTPTATVMDIDGKARVLPLIDGDEPDDPITGSESNQDDRTVPVTIGTTGDKSRTNSWSELDSLYGGQGWYTTCANTNLAMTWSSDVPRFIGTEGEHDNRFILAVNVSHSLTDTEIRQRASDDGNPNVGSLAVIRVGSIINTRHLSQNRCDPFIDTRSMIRVSLGKVIFDDAGQFKELAMDKGAFVDCHNLWRLPKSAPIPSAAPSSSPSTLRTTPPPTRPSKSSKCAPPQVENPNGVCLTPKDPSQGAGHKGNVPTQVQGTNPPAGNTAEPRPSNPPATYRPPPTQSQQAPVRTTIPPPENPAPQPSVPATGCAPPPGMTAC